MISKWFRLLFLALLVSFLMGGMLVLSGSIHGGLDHPVAAMAANSVDSMNFLPLILRGYPPDTPFGVELYNINTQGGLDYMYQAGNTWVRRNGLSWATVEPTQPTQGEEPNWSAVASLEVELKNAAARGMEVILIVRGTPVWAATNPNVPCGPIQQAHFQSFGKFLQKAVARYSVPPYSVKYWEIYNEPDVPPKSGEEFGCWGDATEPYYGGQYYGEMLKVVYPIIKAADPNAKVLVGGLLLDCDPNNVCTSGAANKPPKFLQGILETGAGDSFDGVSFHAYDYYRAALGNYSNGNWNSSWDTTGPVLIAKAQFIKSLLNSYGTSGKFLMNTESALLRDVTCDADCQETKASYLVQAYVAAKIVGLRANVWYSFYGWRNSGLSDGVNLLPAYDAYSFAFDKLGTAMYVQEVDIEAGVKAYEFMLDNNRIWVVWAIDGANHDITLSSNPQAIWDKFGGSIPTTGTDVTVTADPLYIELHP